MSLSSVYDRWAICMRLAIQPRFLLIWKHFRLTKQASGATFPTYDFLSAFVHWSWWAASECRWLASQPDCQHGWDHVAMHWRNNRHRACEQWGPWQIRKVPLPWDTGVLSPAQDFWIGVLWRVVSTSALEAFCYNWLRGDVLHKSMPVLFSNHSPFGTHVVFGRDQLQNNADRTTTTGDRALAVSWKAFMNDSKDRLFWIRIKFWFIYVRGVCPEGMTSS